MSIQVRKGNRKLIKDLNRNIVLNQIRVNGPISRTDISKQTKLGLSTITNIVDSLLEDSLVYEVGSGSSSGGRKPVLLQFNVRAGAIVGVKIEPSQIVVAMADLETTIFEKQHVPLPVQASNDEVIDLIIQQVTELNVQLPPTQKLYGIGIAVSGLVNRSQKKVIHSPILDWNDYDFSDLEAHFDVPVFVDNDANVFTAAHMWTGIGKFYHNFIGVTIGIGIGAGIVIDSNLYRGHLGGAGEFGHLVIQREGSVCHCGQRGCLEMYASDQYLIQEAYNTAKHGWSTHLSPDQPLTVDDVYEAAMTHDDHAIQHILVKQGENLGIGLKSVVNLLNPEAIILGGEGIRGMPYVGKGIHQELDSHFFSGKGPKLNVHLSDLGDNVWLIGACALVLEDLFRTPIYQ